MRPSSVLRGKVAVVTQGSEGIGLIIAASLAQAGAKVTFNGWQMEQVEAVYGQFTSIPGVEVLGTAHDLRRPEEVDALAEQTINRFGGIDIWFNSSMATGPLARAGDLPLEAWQGVVESNMTATFVGTQVALQHMLPREQGKIINLVGFGAVEGERVPDYLSAYAASQAGVLRFTQSVADTYRESALSILTLVAGFPASDLETAAASTPEAEQRLTAVRETLAAQAPDREELGELAVRVAGRETDGVTGKLYRLKPPVGQRLRGLLGGRQ